MSVSSVNGYDPSQQTQQSQQSQQMQQMQQMQALLGIQGINPNSATTSLATNLTAPSTTDQVNFSQTGQLMSQLSQLQKSNPSEFSAATQQISQELSSQAQNCADPRESQKLAAFSQQFAQASQTGSMSPLASGHHAGHGHRARGGAKGGALSDVDSDISQSLASLSSNAGLIGSNAGLSGGLFGALNKIIANDLNAMASNAGISGSGSASPGQLLGQLHKLQKNDPAEFQAVTEKISQDLAAQASSSTDPMQRRMLTDFSRKFADASQTGSMASLRPGHDGLAAQSPGTGGQLQADMQELASVLTQGMSGVLTNATSTSNWGLLQGMGSTANGAYPNSSGTNQSMGAILNSAVYG
jgi:hypothetical protein